MSVRLHHVSVVSKAFLRVETVVVGVTVASDAPSIHAFTTSVDRGLCHSARNPERCRVVVELWYLGCLQLVSFMPYAVLACQ